MDRLTILLTTNIREKTEMEKSESRWTEKAIENRCMKLVDGRYSCGICGREYVVAGTCKNHINRDHGEQILEEATLMEKEDNNSTRDFYIISVGEWFPKIEKTFKEDKEKFLKRLTENSIENTLGWEAEGMVIQEETFRLALVANNIITRMLEDNKSWEEIYTGLVEYENGLKDDLSQNPYRHNSTSLMSNSVEEWKTRAKADFLSGYLHTITEVKQKIEEIIELS